MSTQTSDNNKRIAKNIMICSKITKKITNINRNIIYNTKNILLNSVASSVICPPIFQRVIYRAFGYHIHSAARVYPQCFCGAGKGKLVVGKGSYVNYRCFLDLGADIIIGKNVSVAFNCTFINSTHEFGTEFQRAGKGKSDKIIIKDGCWIGANVTIMPGVTIGQGCIIGSNSLVISDTEPNSLYVGQPAKKLKNIR